MVNKYLKGGKSEGMTLSQVAKLHNMNAEQLKPQLNKGIKHELEHTRNLKEARRIALDHLVEFPDYYDRLDKIEKMHLGGDMSKHLAPNGKPSNLTHEQWHLVRTPEFKAWFGDWENDPENASKVVDENGEPLVVHHGSIVETNFDIFDYQKADLGFHFGTEEQAKNRVESKGVLPSRKSIVNSFFLNIRVLFEMSDAGEWQYPQRYVDELMSDNIIEEKVAKQKGFLSLNMREDNAIIRDYLKSKYGNSVGFVYNNKYEGKGKSFIVLSPNEIKLADGSNTTFDGENPDIRFDKGGEIENLIDQGEIELKVYPTTPKHANLYGLKSENPLYIQTIFISENQRLKGIGKKVLKYLNDFAIENGHDVMFGHITQKASFSKDDSRESNLDDVAMIKNWLQSNGYEICEGNNDFYKVVNNPDIRFEKGGLIAPNGKSSNLTPQQYDLVRTPEFKAWFGDWENDPENASKVVDENGEPLVLWHYSRTLKNEVDKFYIFNVDKELGSHFGLLKQSQYLKYQSKDDREFDIVKEEVSDFRYYQVFLNIRNPIRLKDVGVFKLHTLINAIGEENIEDNDWLYIHTYNEKSQDTDIDRAKYIAKSKFGYDGAVYLNRYESDAKVSFIMSLDEVSDKTFKTKVPSAEDSWIAFEPNQIKLADGTNTTFDSGNPDIRFEKGGLIAPNGKPSNLTPQQYDLVRTPEFKAWFGDWENDPENASKVRDENGEPLVVYRGYPKKRKFPFVFEYKYRMFGKSGVAGREKNEFAFYFTDLKKVAENYGENLADDDEAFVVKEYFLNIRNIFKAYSRKNQYEITFKELYDLANYTGKPIYELNPDNEVALFYQKNEKGQYEMLPREYWNYDYSTINRYRDSEPKETFAYFVDWDKNSSNQFFWGSYLRRYLKYDGLVFYERTHNSTLNPDRDENNYHSIEKPWVIPQFGDEFSKTYAVFESNQIKLADGTNTTFDGKNPDIRFDKGGRTIAQTPAPASDRVYGSKTNPKGSASDSELAKSIKFNDKLEKAIQNKVDEFNDKHPSNKVSLSTAKAIVRRGMGAYSKSHRPTISGGAPNSRQAWGLARLNKFLLKKSGVKVKKAYVQDDDLLKYAKGGKINTGDCYEVAGRMALMEASKAPNGEIFLGQPKVVHGEVAGQGSLEGIRYGHAWVEDDVYVYDFSNGRELMILKEVYYYLGKIMQEKPKLYKYTFKEATKKMVESRNFGPWDLITESGL